MEASPKKFSRGFPSCQARRSKRKRDLRLVVYLKQAWYNITAVWMYCVTENYRSCVSWRAWKLLEIDLLNSSCTDVTGRIAYKALLHAVYCGGQPCNSRGKPSRTFWFAFSNSACMVREYYFSNELIGWVLQTDKLIFMFPALSDFQYIVFSGKRTVT